MNVASDRMGWDEIRGLSGGGGTLRIGVKHILCRAMMKSDMIFPVRSRGKYYHVKRELWFSTILYPLYDINNDKYQS